MANTVTLTVTPNAYPTVPITTPPTAAPTLLLTALVVNELGEPQPNVTVTFSTPFEAPYPLFTPNPDTAITNMFGIAAGPDANYGASFFGRVLQITASIDDDSDTVSIPIFTTGSPTTHVSNASDGVIDQYDINAGIQATIPLQAGLTAGNVVRFFWGSRILERTLEYNEAGQLVGLPWIINIKTTFPTASVLSNGQYRVFYAITDDYNFETSNTRTSAPRTITVQGSSVTPSTLAAPILNPLTLNNRINLLAAFGNPFLHIPASPSLVSGGTYSVFLIARPNSPSANVPISRTVASNLNIPATATTMGIDVLMTYASGVLLGIDNSEGDFYYTVNPGGTPPGPQAASRHLLVEIDTVAPAPLSTVSEEDDDHHHGGHGHGHGHDHRPGWDRDDKYPGRDSYPQ